MLNLVSIPQAAHILHVNHMTMRRWIWNQWFPAYRVGPKIVRVYFIDVEVLRLKAQEVQQQFPFGNLNTQRLGVLARAVQFPSKSR